MGKNVDPRKGTVSAPTAAAAPRPFTFGPTTKSAPTAAPGVAHTKTPPPGGDKATPTSIRSNVAEPVAPKRGSNDPNIGRTA